MDIKGADVGYTIEPRIRADDPYDVRQWSLVLGVIPETLVEATREVGDDAQSVKAFLDKRGSRAG